MQHHVHLFLVSRTTHLISQLLDTDFTIFYFLVESKEESESLVTAEDIQENQLAQIDEEKETLRKRLEVIELENRDLRREYEQMDKIVHDRDRQARGFEK